MACCLYIEAWQGCNWGEWDAHFSVRSCVIFLNYYIKDHSTNMDKTTPCKHPEEYNSQLLLSLSSNKYLKEGTRRCHDVHRLLGPGSRGTGIKGDDAILQSGGGGVATILLLVLFLRIITHHQISLYGHNNPQAATHSTTLLRLG